MITYFNRRCIRQLHYVKHTTLNTWDKHGVGSYATGNHTGLQTVTEVTREFKKKLKIFLPHHL